MEAVNTRHEWLKARRTGIGGSDAAAVAGISPWTTPYELWLDKTGAIAIKADDEVPEFMRWGNRLEQAIADEYSERTGRKVRRMPELRRSKVHPFMLANIDRKIEGENRLLEIKKVGEFSFRDGDWGEAGTNEVPDHYALQVQHYMAVTGYDMADLAVLVGGNRMLVYEIPRDDEIIEDLISLEADFWAAVEARKAPAIDYSHPSIPALMKRRYAGTDGVIIDLPGEALEWHTERDRLKAEIKALEAKSAEFDARLREAVGEHAAGRLPEGAGAYRRNEVGESEVSYTRKAYFDFRFVKKV